MLRDDPGEVVEGEWTDDDGPRYVRVGHHRSGVRIDQHGLHAFGPERETRLYPRVVKLGGLADDDRSGTDHQHALRRDHARARLSRAPSSAADVARSKTRAASMGPGAPSGWNWTDAMRPDA